MSKESAAALVEYSESCSHTLLRKTTITFEIYCPSLSYTQLKKWHLLLTRPANSGLAELFQLNITSRLRVSVPEYHVN